MTIKFTDNNIYDFRFKILYHFYAAIFYSVNITTPVVEYFRTRYEIPHEEFVINNVDYLLKCGYLSDQGSVITITPKGIKFVEGITDGEISFDAEKISREILSLLRRMFREQDTFV